MKKVRLEWAKNLNIGLQKTEKSAVFRWN